MHKIRHEEMQVKTMKGGMSAVDKIRSQMTYFKVDLTILCANRHMRHALCDRDLVNMIINEFCNLQWRFTQCMGRKRQQRKDKLNVVKN